MRPLFVANPYAPELRFADHVTRTRRDHMKYLTLISAVAFLHQHQRRVLSVEHGGQRIEYIEATEGDVAIATRLANTVLSRSLDELPPQTRRLLGEIATMVEGRMAEEGWRGGWCASAGARCGVERVEPDAGEAAHGAARSARVPGALPDARAARGLRARVRGGSCLGYDRTLVGVGGGDVGVGGGDVGG
ncbi:MAG: hypothetical protein IPG04_25240 [Polyangiaceae bacterium]|nr:hypothetical protein [Polyangiaceae bacterium]